MAYASRSGMFVSSLEFQVDSCLYVTAAVQAASHFGTAYVAAAAEVCSRFIGTCRELSRLASPSLPFLSLLFGVFLNGRLRITPFFLWCVPGRLFVAGNTCLFLFSPLPFSPSLFLSFSLSSPPSFLLGCPWMLLS